MKPTGLLDVLVLLAVLLWALKCGDAQIAEQYGGGRYHSNGFVHYSREYLLQLQSAVFALPAGSDSFPSEIVSDHGAGVDVQPKNVARRKRGHRGGVKRRLRRYKTRTPLPSIVLANTRSLRPKVPNYNFDELCAYVQYMEEFKNSCLLCFSETWFDSRITDESVYVHGFGMPFRSDRDPLASGKQHGGAGMCLYVHEQYCNRANVTVRSQLCTRDIDLLSVSLRPRYLFTSRIWPDIHYCGVCPSQG